jgi:hypothetical protein
MKICLNKGKKWKRFANNANINIFKFADLVYLGYNWLTSSARYNTADPFKLFDFYICNNITTDP